MRPVEVVGTSPGVDTVGADPVGAGAIRVERRFGERGIRGGGHGCSFAEAVRRNARPVIGADVHGGLFSRWSGTRG